MGKDANGNFHPPKGKPSGVGKSEGLGLQPTPPNEMEEYNEITGEYLNEPDQIADNVHFRHANRNTSKGEASFKAKNKNPVRNRSLGEKDTENKEQMVEMVEMPSPMTKELFKQIANIKNDCCISIFLDTHKEGEAVNNNIDHTAFKNALQQCDAMMDEKGVNAAIKEKMLTPGYRLLQDQSFWKSMKDGLCVFIGEDDFRYMKMTCKPGHHVVLDKSFYMIPLLPQLLNDKHYFLLTVSKNVCKLYKGNTFGLEYVEVADMPDGIMEIISDRGVATTFRSGDGDPGSGSLHGVGDGSENDNVYLTRYLQRVDDAVWKQLLSTQSVPLVLCGVEYVIALFKEVSQYKYISDKSVTGNHDFETTDDLFKLVSPLVEEYLKNDRHGALNKYGDLSATQKTSENAKEVISASYYGKIQDLFIKKDAHLWGNFDVMQNKVTVLNKANEDAEDLVDNAAVNTIMNGGCVYVLEGNMPNDSKLAATFRY